jgi:predicted DCC family thiol-disulfide oxidoreductase YuxK
MSSIIIYYDAKCKHCKHFSHRHLLRKDGSKSKRTVAFCNNDRSFLHNENLTLKTKACDKIEL